MKHRNLLLSVTILLVVLTLVSVASFAGEKKVKANNETKKVKMEQHLLGPGHLIQRAQELELSEDQMKALKKLLIDTRTKANALLTPTQTKKLKTMQMKVLKMKGKKMKKACPSESSKPCDSKKKQ